MFGQHRLSACALVLLASLVIASQVDAGGLKDLFNREKSYVKLANQLYEATPSGELKDNVAAAIEVHRKRDPSKRDPNYEDLLVSFGSLKVGKKQIEAEQLCRNFDLGSLRILAEAMAVHGNLEPKKITEPIRRLNRILIKQISKARATCFSYLARQWPKPWKVAQEWPHVYAFLCKLDSLSRPLLLDSQPRFKAKELDHFMSTLETTCWIIKGDKILKPYVDLHMASHIIDPSSNKLAKFYEDPQERIVLGPVDHPNQELHDNAYRYRACEMLAASAKKEF